LLGNECQLRAGEKTVTLPTRKGSTYLFDQQLQVKK